MEPSPVDQVSSSSNTLLYVLIGVGVVLVLVVLGVAVWLARRNTGQAPQPALGGQYGQPMPQAQMAPGWYPDPRGQARLRWFDGARWTPDTQN